MMSAEALEAIINCAGEAIFVKDEQRRYVVVNDVFCETTGIPRDRFLGKTDYELCSKEQADFFCKRDDYVLETGNKDIGEEQFVNAQGDIRTMVAKKILYTSLSGEKFIVGTIIDITEQEKAQAESRKSEEKFKKAFYTNPESININRLSDGLYVSVNKGFSDLTGYSEEEVLGKTSIEIDIWHNPKDRAELIEGLNKHGKVENLEAQFRLKNGGIKHGMMSATLIEIDGSPHILNITRDITHRKRAEEEKTKLQAQLHQAQKMESIGRLAGGVAHDFNNILSVILGYSQLAMTRCNSSAPIYADLEAIESSAIRSSALVRQLLAFAREQTVAPKILDLNDIIAGMLKMLQRLIGENIDFSWMPGAGLWRIKIDPSQIDQLLANLCVNARDAITGVGKITIETGNKVFDKAYCEVNPDCIPGDYVMLAVSDNGCGIGKDAMDHIYEPFFTTKEKGRGIGLGLATVYGIVKQNGGFINLYSEPGKGAAFNIYFPRVLGAVMESTPSVRTEIPKGNGEIILLVEDEETILNLSKKMLEILGYVALTAGTPGEALRQAEIHGSQIRLLVTDVVMPEMNGKDLAKLLNERIPGLKCLFSSGYTSNIIAHHGILEEGVHFLQKPYSIKDLATKVYEALKQGPREAA